jgi:ubiquinone/menaquinone biosynthesis C-methylase UbiE
MAGTSNYLKHTSGNPLQRFLINNFYKNVFKLIKPSKPQTILDVGCGEGFTLVNLGRNRIGKNFEGIDNSKVAIRVGKKLYPSLNLKEGDIYNLPHKDKSFDLVICTEVLEHLENPKAALAELKRVAKKNILLSVPNEPFFILANFLRGKYLMTLGNNPEHINHWSAGGFRKFLRANGLKISQTSYPFPWTIVFAKS